MKVGLSSGALAAFLCHGGHPLFGADIGDTPSPPPTAGAASVADELKKLAELRSEGVLSDEEFEAQKSPLLAGR